MRGDDFVEGVRRKLRQTGSSARITDKMVAKRLGLTLTGLSNWRRRRQVTVRQAVGLLFKMEQSAVKEAAQGTIRPIVEFFKLDPVDSRGGRRTEIFSVRKAGERADHPYLRGLRHELDAHCGIYIFYDSRGRALYAGKARKQKLWNEINNAYNRERTVQQVRRVKHPERKQNFRTSDEKRRQIALHVVPLHELAFYVSAYAVKGDLIINELESLLIRSFANDLLNVRMENFGWED